MASTYLSPKSDHDANSAGYRGREAPWLQRVRKTLFRHKFSANRTYWACIAASAHGARVDCRKTTTAIAEHAETTIANQTTDFR